MEIKRIIAGQLQANCYLLIDSGELGVVDPGAEGQKIIAEIKKIGARVKIIIVTHNHFDHIGATYDLENEFKVKTIRDLKEGDILTIGKEKLKTIKTPGHAADSICLLGDGFALTGDTLFDGNIGRTDLEGGSNQAMAESLKKLDQSIPNGAMVYPGHGDVFKYKKREALKYLQFLN